MLTVAFMTQRWLCEIAQYDIKWQSIKISPAYTCVTSHGTVQQEIVWQCIKCFRISNKTA